MEQLCFDFFTEEKTEYIPRMPAFLDGDPVLEKHFNSFRENGTNWTFRQVVSALFILKKFKKTNLTLTNDQWKYLENCEILLNNTIRNKTTVL